jgi:hypothetical protein
MRDANGVVEGALSGCQLRSFAVCLGDHHIAPITMAAIKVSACGSAGLNWRDHFEKVPADRHEGIFKAENLNARVDITRFDAKDFGKIRHNGLELLSHQTNLSKL